MRFKKKVKYCPICGFEIKIEPCLICRYFKFKQGLIDPYGDPL